MERKLRLRCDFFRHKLVLKNEVVHPVASEEMAQLKVLGSKSA
jgi:hypothetical protein